MANTQGKTSGLQGYQQVSSSSKLSSNQNRQPHPDVFIKGKGGGTTGLPQ